MERRRLLEAAGPGAALLAAHRAHGQGLGISTAGDRATNGASPGRLRVVILHGAYGRPASNWFPWLAGHVQAAGHEALLPRFPTPQGQSPEAWLDAYGRQVDDAVPRSRTVLVAHSLGVAFALRLAARAGVADPYRGAFLAAGFWGARCPARGAARRPS